MDSRLLAMPDFLLSETRFCDLVVSAPMVCLVSGRAASSLVPPGFGRTNTSPLSRDECTLGDLALLSSCEVGRSRPSGFGDDAFSMSARELNLNFLRSSSIHDAPRKQCSFLKTLIVCALIDRKFKSGIGAG